MDNFPGVSVIINTDSRANQLSTCLESLRYLRYPNFEVVVVAGPTRDGTHELCERYADEIKFGNCPLRNLSMSRNIAIQISSGELIAFLDDDSVPEPEWLKEIVPSFQDPEVAVAGGFLHDHTGKSYQWRYGTVNRYGKADQSWNRPTPEYNFPYSYNIPHVMANSIFRRTAIVEVGGFDEEYEYFLDETDLITRLVDNGWKIAQLDKGFVHHKFMPSHIRNETKTLTSWYSVTKSQAYFPLLNGASHISVDEALDNIQSVIQFYREHNKWAVENGGLEASLVEKFEEEVDRALRDGISSGFNGTRKLVDSASLTGHPEFKRFSPLLADSDQRCIIFISQTYPPGNSIGGIGRYTHHLAREVAKFGHQVHVLTRGEDHDRVDFEERVWVHRICIRESPPPEGMSIPLPLWHYSNTMLEEAVEIASRREIDCVYAPIWDVEGIAFLGKNEFKLVTSLHTTFRLYLDCNPQKFDDIYYMENHAKPMLELEQRVLLESDSILANSQAIVDEIEQAHGIKLDRQKLNIVPHGLDDWSNLKADPPSPVAPGTLRICYVGRLEPRKGADVFLKIVPSLVEKYNNIHIDIVGNDAIELVNGTTFRSRFESEFPGYANHSQVIFHGVVSEEKLRGFYQSADIIVAPSRMESFGLVHLEGLIYGKPVIGCNIGGMKEVIEDGITGLLAEPGDPESLLDCIESLINDEQLRTELGENARSSFLEKFTARQMAKRLIENI